MKVIGLVGGCGTGKSEVAMLLKNRYHAYILTADEIGHKIILKGTPGYNKVVDYFGKRILDEEGEINRKLLGAIVFNDDQELVTLNTITHPFMYDKIEKTLIGLRSEKLYNLVILEAAVMIEAGFIDFLDSLWLVTCTMEKRIERLMSYRGLSLEKIEKIISKQRSEEEYLQYAQIVIDNSFDIAQTLQQIQLVTEKILEEDHEK